MVYILVLVMVSKHTNHLASHHQICVYAMFCALCNHSAQTLARHLLLSVLHHFIMHPSRVEADICSVFSNYVQNLAWVGMVSAQLALFLHRAKTLPKIQMHMAAIEQTLTSLFNSVTKAEVRMRLAVACWQKVQL